MYVVSGNSHMYMGIYIQQLYIYVRKLYTVLYIYIYKIKRQQTNPVLKQPEVVDYLMSFQKKFVLTPIDKASNNVSIICKRYYVEVVLKEIGILGSGNETYEKANRSKEEIVDDNREYS